MNERLLKKVRNFLPDKAAVEVRPRKPFNIFWIQEQNNFLKFHLNKKAFQLDAYRPVVDRIL